MKAVIGTVVCAAALVVAGAAPSHAAPQSTSTATTTTAQTSLESRISKKLNADPLLKKYNIKVSADGSVVRLTGTVPTEADRAKAASLAKVDGVTRVDNQIIVDLNSATAATTGTVEHGVDKGTSKTKEGISKGAEKTAEGVDKAGSGVKTGYEKSKDATVKAAGKTEEAVGKGVSKGAEGTAKGLDKAAEGVSKAGEAITDGFLTSRVKTKFTGEDLLKGSDINVDTDNHVVTLSGTVPTAAGRARAVALAKSVDGVHRVIDNLKIGPKKPE
jgi:hyperosmotically inducible protein